MYRYIDPPGSSNIVQLLPLKMPGAVEQKPLKVCLVSDDDLMAAAVRINCPPPHQVHIVALNGIVDDRNALSACGQAMIQSAISYDVILIDWDLERAPIINLLCFHIRRQVAAPLIALCRGIQDTQVAALVAGADDVTTFPFYPPLLHARKIAYRRLVEAARSIAPITLTSGQTGSEKNSKTHDVLLLGELRLDRIARTCSVGEENVDLTLREYALLNYFMQNAESACTRYEILDHVWGIQFDTGTNMVDVYVYFLRRKLAGHGFKGMIQTVRGYGYRLTAVAGHEGIT